MNIKLKIFGFGLIGWLSIANAYEIGETVSAGSTYGDIAISLSRDNEINIYAVSTKIYDHPKNMSEIFTVNIKTITKKLWTITPDQLSITDNICYNANVSTCNPSNYCHNHCLLNTPPDIIAFDEKNKKIYINYASYEVGTGGGPSLLFVADINKHEIKFLRGINVDEKGSVSPSGRYFVVHYSSVLSIYDTEKNAWFKMNKSQNEYTTKERNVRHSLKIVKWLSDTRFIYIDHARYFTRGSEPMPFINATEITYDIATKTKLNDKVITEKEYDELMKKDQD